MWQFLSPQIPKSTAIIIKFVDFRLEIKSHSMNAWLKMTGVGFFWHICPFPSVYFWAQLPMLFFQKSRSLSITFFSNGDAQCSSKWCPFPRRPTWALNEQCLRLRGLWLHLRPHLQLLLQQPLKNQGLSCCLETPLTCIPSFAIISLSVVEKNADCWTNGQTDASTLLSHCLFLLLFWYGTSKFGPWS